MSEFDVPLYNLSELMADFQSCAVAAGFCTIKFGPPEHINFDHNICYDLLNIDYPSSYIAEGIKEVYAFDLVLARPFSQATTQGVQLFDTEVAQIFSDLEIKFWNMVSCLALGISGGGGCSAHIPKHKITIEREKGLFNDKLVALRIRFEAIANIAVTVDACSGSGNPDNGCDDPCEAFFGACGCTDPDAVNYNPAAGVDDGTCCYGALVDPCIDTPPVFPPANLFPPDQTNNPA
tara:strand:+ start:390 stop:1094 length:705 start_codon:yes stop_codon:yes gene_type:complete